MGIKIIVMDIYISYIIIDLLKIDLDLEDTWDTGIMGDI